jgi:hypothetical protein
MSKRHPPGPPMTLGNMRAHGVQHLIALLHECCQARHVERRSALLGRGAADLVELCLLLVA